MQIELTDPQMKQLAREIALAQLTIIDDEIDRVTSTWSDTVKSVYHVPRVGDTRNGQFITAAERWEAFRAVRTGAEAMVQREAQEAKEAAERNKKAIEEHQARQAKQLEQNKLRHEADIARWKADVAVAQANGRPAPPKPTAPPLSVEELASQAQRDFVRGAF